MKDFDDLFSERLNEEASFPSRAKNWRDLSKRLDAFDVGTTVAPRPRLRIWQALTAVSLVTAGLLVWKNISVEHYNKALKQEMVAMQTDLNTLHQDFDSLKRQAPKQETESSNTANNTKQYDANLYKPESSINNPATPSRMDPVKKGTTQAGSPSMEASPEANATTKQQKKKSNTALASAPQSVAPAPGLSESKPKLEDASPSVARADVNKDAITEVAKTTPTTSSAAETLPLESSIEKTDSVAVANPVSSVASTPATPDSLSNLASTAQKEETPATVPPPTPMITPSKGDHKRFRAGAGVNIGFAQPGQKGVSALVGQSIRAEFKLVGSLWLNASADWMHYDVSTEKFHQDFHPHHDSLPHPPDHGGSGGPGNPHDAELVLVESSLRQQQYGLGLRYELPVHFWLTPSVRVSHTWIHTSPTLVTYKFEEEDHGSPGGPPYPRVEEYVAEKFKGQWLDNQWRLGVGLERATQHWVFGVWADYSKNLNQKKPAFDAVYVQAGLAYRF